MSTSFSDGRSRSTRREPPTMGKQLVNCIICSCESSAPFLLFTKTCANPRRIGDRLVCVVRWSNYLTHWATRAVLSNRDWGSPIEMHITTKVCMTNTSQCRGVFDFVYQLHAVVVFPPWYYGFHHQLNWPQRYTRKWNIIKTGVKHRYQWR